MSPRYAALILFAFSVTPMSARRAALYWRRPCGLGRWGSGRNGDRSPAARLVAGGPAQRGADRTEHGAKIIAGMRLNTWAAFAGTEENAQIAGDVAMLESEVTPVLKALRKNGLNVVALHHHMTRVCPMIIFLHYWGRGPAGKLAAGFRAALDELGKGGASQASR